jgi:para-nitrobenzyl esterase
MKSNKTDRNLPACCKIGVALIAALGLSTGVLAHGGGSNSRTDVVRTSDGPVKGLKQEGVNVFLGIPFAAPPTGELRWRPPQPPSKWSRTRDTVAFAGTCAQTNTLGAFAAPSMNEDCLYLNVFAPSRGRKDDGRDAWDDGDRDHDERGWDWGDHGKRRLPVMVWIHGGGLFDGSSNEYDGRKLAKDGDVVVVTINYRLNIFGYLAHPALDAEGHAFGNYGYMDQQFALRWVQKNIAAFGGDPGNVTIFGESAGGNSVLAAMASPTAKGLFHRVIAESGSYVAVAREQKLADARNYGSAFAAAAGCSNQSAACLRSLSVQDIIARAGQFTGTAVTMVDGSILKNTIVDTLNSGKFNRVPIINGANRDEMTWFVGITELATGHALTVAEYPAALATQFGAANAPDILHEYPVSDFNSPSEALAAAYSSQIMVCPQRTLNRILSRYVPTYGYEFADRSAPSAGPTVSFPYGAAHTFEIQYLFSGYHGATGTVHPLNTAQKKLSDDMVSYWTTFAKTGNPNSRETPDWPGYNSNKDQYQALQLPRPVVTSTYSTRHKCDFWDGLAARAQSGT